MRLNKPIVGMAPTPDGQGYWFVASDGGVFAFGDAPFYGSVGGVPHQVPGRGHRQHRPPASGYWFTNDNGAVSAFGNATYWGSAPQVLNKPVVGMARRPAAASFGASTYPSGSYGYDVSNYQCAKPPPRPPHHRRRRGRRLLVRLRATLA